VRDTVRMLTLALTTLRRLLPLGRREAADGQGFASTRPVDGKRLGSHLIFRLKAWPELPESGRTAEIYRMLSVMSSQPVNRQWLLARCNMPPAQLDALLLQLMAEDAVEVIDPAQFAGREPCRA
jgi:hypothetical protein